MATPERGKARKAKAPKQKPKEGHPLRIEPHLYKLGLLAAGLEKVSFNALVRHLLREHLRAEKLWEPPFEDEATKDRLRKLRQWAETKDDKESRKLLDVLREFGVIDVVED